MMSTILFATLAITCVYGAQLPYRGPVYNTYGYNGQPATYQGYNGAQQRSDNPYNRPAYDTYTNTYNGPQSNPNIPFGAPQMRSDAGYNTPQVYNQPQQFQQSYMPYNTAPQMRSDMPQSSSYSAQYNTQPQYPINAPQMRSDMPYNGNMGPADRPYAPYAEMRASAGKCCPDETNSCGGALAAKMIRENCGGFQPKEGMLYSCQNFQPREILGCKQCLITGDGINDVCIPADSWNKRLIDIGGWMRIRNSTELRCCSEDVKYCGRVLFSEVDGSMCQVQINENAFYGCRNGQPYELAPSCEQCITTGEGTNDICMNGQDRFKLELDIAALILAPENQKKPALVPGGSQ